MNEQKTHKNRFKEALPLIYLIVALLALRFSFIEPYVVPTPSMEPTLKKGDRLYALKCSYDLRFPFFNWKLLSFRSVKRGDVILFLAPHEPEKIYVKRAVAVAGDLVSVVNGSVVVNGVEVPKMPAQDVRIMSDIERASEKSLYIADLDSVQHHMILDNFRPVARNFPQGTPFFDGENSIKVPEGHVFAMGDNRDQSFDSRGWGFVPLENLKGQAMFIWFSSWDWKVRPERIGTLIR